MAKHVFGKANRDRKFGLRPGVSLPVGGKEFPQGFVVDTMAALDVGDVPF